MTRLEAANVFRVMAAMLVRILETPPLISGSESRTDAGLPVVRITCLWYKIINNGGVSSKLIKQCQRPKATG